MRGRFIFRRSWQALVVLLAAYLVAFLLLAALPGDAVMARYASPELGLSADQIEQIRQQLGADQPLHQRFFTGLSQFATGNLGNSLATGASVGSLLAEAIPSTLILALCGFVTAVLLAVTLALLATYGQQRWVRRLARSFPPVLVSLPVFWVGIILIQVFSFQLGWIPVIGAGPIQQLILPSLALAVPVGAPLAQVLINSIDETNEQPFVNVVKARGARPSWVLTRNVLRNASLPAITMGGVLFTELVSNAVITETVFGRPGIGRLTIDAVAMRDTPVLLAIVVLCAFVFVVINLVIDLAYPVIDRRLRTEVAA